MASYEATTTLDMQATVLRAREYFELRHHLPNVARLGALQRWQGVDSDTIELRLYPIKEGGTRLELETLRSDELVQGFITDLPQPWLLDELKRRLKR